MTGRDRVAAYLADRNVSRETLDRLDLFVAYLVEGSKHQNLVSAATLAAVWDRHILDSLQLLPLTDQTSSSWIDVGSGAGLPGLVVAASGQPVTLVEPRRRRVEFLERSAAAMGVEARIVLGRAEAQTGLFDTISARAVAPLEQLFELTSHLSHQSTRFVFPKGRTARNELEAAQRSWQGRFELIPSITDPDAAIVVASGVRRRKSR